ncbi:MAG: hypothetical protein ACOYI4_09635 [Christensenellales bacterium]|jgi:hypothetical protein
MRGELSRFLGMQLAEAVALAQQMGFVVRTEETRSRRGVEGADSIRVVRALADTASSNRVVLTYSRFKTNLK